MNGVYSPLASDSRGYLRGELLDLEVEVRGSQILVWRNGEPLFAVEDESHSSGTVGLYTQDQALYDNVRIDTPSTAPALVLGSPLAYLTSSGQLIRASAAALNAPVGATVEFSLNSTAPVADPAPPYDVTFPSVVPGNYEVVATLRSGSGAELGRDTNSVVGIGGEYFVSVGDSITNGDGDNFSADNLSLLGRIIGWRGYQGGLTDLLDSTASFPTQLVFNEGIGGDKSYTTAYVRVDSIVARHPGMDTALVLLGTNDATGIIPSGQNCSGTSCNGTFKQNMQTLVDKLAASGTTPVVALPPPAWTSTSPWTSSTNNRIREYISVIKNELVGIALGPDFFSFFMPSATANHRSLFSDTLHPNALGYRVMSYLWYNAHSPSVQPLPFLLSSLGLSSGRLVQQNLLEAGDSYYIDEAFTLRTIPAVLAEGRWVMTANADRSSTAADYVTFDVDRAVDVYIAYDAGATGLPSWMSGFLDTGLTLTTSNAAADSLKLYRATYGAGAITLGGNLSGSATGAETNYVVIVVERP